MPYVPAPSTLPNRYSDLRNEYQRWDGRVAVGGGGLLIVAVWLAVQLVHHARYLHGQLGHPALELVHINKRTHGCLQLLISNEALGLCSQRMSQTVSLLPGRRDTAASLLRVGVDMRTARRSRVKPPGEGVGRIPSKKV